MIDFLFVYEHKNREIENICLLKAELELRGFLVDLVQVNSVNTLQYLFFKKPKVVISFCLYSNKELVYNVYRIAGKIKKVVNFQCEQMRFEKMVEMKCGIPTEFAANATHVCWGPYSQRLLVENGVKNAVVTGPIHIDLLQKKFIHEYLTRKELLSEYGIDHNKHVLLYISSFSYTTATERMIQHLKNFFEDQAVDGLCKLHIKTKIKTLEWFENILQEREDIVIIYRPHPSEFSDSCLIELEKKYSNFKVVTDYSIKQWILVSDNNYTMFSTSIVEALFADKMCHILRPYKVEEELDYFFYHNAKEIKSYEEFRQSVDMRDVKQFPLKKEKLEECYSYSKYAYEKIADLLQEVRNTDKYDMEVSFDFRTLIIKEVMKNLFKKFLLRTRAFEKLYMKLPYNHLISEFYEIYDYSIKEEINKIDIYVKVERMKEHIQQED